MTIVRFTGGRRVDVIDSDCEFRPCFQWGEDKGAFTPGVGYTSYYRDGPKPVCMTRHLRGCPTVAVHLRCEDCHAASPTVTPYGDDHSLPEPSPCAECGSKDTYWLADVLPPPNPCCENMRVARRGHEPMRQRCLSCRAWLSGARLAAARG